MQLIEQIRGGDRRLLARAITLVEGGGAQAQRLLAQLHAHTGRAQVVGVTGAPGVGKSTLVNALALALRAEGRSVAILAVDPSSPYSGGAILGDRIRMQALAHDPGLYIRSMASRGQAGGVARATGDVIRVLDAAGFDMVVVETIGAGQAEVAIAREAQTVVVVEVPGLGDDVQAIKAGILEIADLFVVNKADRPDADATRRHLLAMMQLGGVPREGWRTPVLMTVATQAGGVAELVAAIDAHQRHLREHGHLAERERQRAAREVDQILLDLLRDQIERATDPQRRAQLYALVAARQIDPHAAAEQLLTSLGLAPHAGRGGGAQ